jgi:hypothetical protein
MAGQSAGQLAARSFGEQTPSPHVPGQSTGHSAKLSLPLQIPSPQKPQSARQVALVSSPSQMPLPHSCGPQSRGQFSPSSPAPQRPSPQRSPALQSAGHVSTLSPTVHRPSPHSSRDGPASGDVGGPLPIEPSSSVREQAHAVARTTRPNTRTLHPPFPRITARDDTCSQSDSQGANR